MPVIDEHIQLLIQSETSNGSTTFVDSSASVRTVTGNGGIAHSTTQAKYGNSSLKFDGTDDFLSTPMTGDLVIGGDDFTKDFWIYPVFPASSITEVFSFEDDTNSYWCYCDLTWEDKLHFFMRVGSVDLEFFTTQVVENEWQHIAIVYRKSVGTIRMYRNGSSVGSDSGTFTTPSPTSTPVFRLGTSTGISRFFEGYIEEFCVADVARWTSSFTPPGNYLDGDTGIIIAPVPTISGTAETFPIVASGGIDSPLLRVSGGATNPITCAGDLVAPIIQIEASTANLAYGSFYSPAFETNGTALTKQYAFGDVEFKPEILGTAITPIHAFGNFKAGIPVTKGYGPIGGYINSPKVSFLGTADTQISCYGNIVAKRPVISGVGLPTNMCQGDYRAKRPAINGTTKYVMPVVGKFTTPLAEISGFASTTICADGNFITKLPRISGRTKVQADDSIIKYERGTCRA